MKKILLTLFLLIFTSVQLSFAGVDKEINVTEVQKRLALLCFDPGPIDGVWGKKTERAVKDVYDSANSKFDGQFDLIDLAFLNEYPLRDGNDCSTILTTEYLADLSLTIPPESQQEIFEDLEALSKREARKLQLSLAQLGYSLGYADGTIGKLTIAAFYHFIGEQNIKSVGLSDARRRILGDAELARKIDVMHYYDDFSSKSLRNYDLPRAAKPPYAHNEPYTFVNNVSSGTSLKIKSKAKHNITNIDQNRYDDNRGRIEQDRFELTLKKGRPKSIEDKPIWIGFRIRKGDVFETHPKSHSNVFQIKQHDFGHITILAVGHGDTASIGNKISIMSDPNKGPQEQDAKTIKNAGSTHIQPKSFQPFNLYKNKADFERWPKQFRMHPTDLPWVSSTECEKGTVYSNFGRRYEGENVVPNIGPMAPILEQNKWTTYKFGILHTRNNNGFLKVYQNDNLIYQYCGRTKETNRTDVKVDVRIGLYRTFKHGMVLNQELYYDDFTVTGSKAVLDAYLGFKRTAPNKEF